MMWANDIDLDEPLSCAVVAETVGARRSLVVRLAQHGLIESVESGEDEPLVPRRVVVRLRRMQRLRRDLGVNFAGAAVILDLVGRIEHLSRELAEVQRREEGGG
jgi:chaperone modulatory protein CbpM